MLPNGLKLVAYEHVDINYSNVQYCSDEEMLFSIFNDSVLS